MNWMYVVLMAAAALIAVRVYMILRRTKAQSRDDWDARMIRDLRSAGANAFTAYDVDFFFSLPDEGACASLRSTLEPEGFVTDTRGMGEAASGFSLHAHKRLRISVSEMQAYTVRFRELAARLGGNYDGWTTDPSRV